MEVCVSTGTCTLLFCGLWRPHLPQQLVLCISKPTHLFWFVINYIYLPPTTPAPPNKSILKENIVTQNKVSLSLYIYLHIKAHSSSFLVLSKEYVYISYMKDIQLCQSIRWRTHATFEQSRTFYKHFLAHLWTHTLKFPSNEAQMGALMHKRKTENRDNKNYK